MDSRNLKAHAYLSNGWGGPYLGRFYPDQKVFFDPRFEAYSPEFVTDVYKHIRYGNPGWESLLVQYQVEIVGLKYTTPGEARLQKNAPNLRQHLAQSKAWMLVYFDDSGELFVRSDGPYQALAMSEGMPGIDPDRMQFFVPPAAVLPALEHAEKTRPASYKLFMYLATAAQDAGDVQQADVYKRRAASFQR